MDKALAPACKVYHAHCKEVKDWVVFAGNVATTPGPSINVCYCYECGIQGGVTALQDLRPGIQILRYNLKVYLHYCCVLRIGPIAACCGLFPTFFAR